MIDFSQLAFGKIDIIILGILLLFAVSGLIKGFVKQILSIANGLISIVVSYLLVTPITNYLVGTTFSNTINGKVLNIIIDKFPNTAEVPIDSVTNKETLIEAFGESGLPGFISKLSAEFIDLDKFQGEYLSDVIAQSLGYLILTFIVFVVLFIVILILIKIIIKILDSLVENGVLKFINKFLGLLLGVAKGAIFICIIMFVISLLSEFINPLKEFMLSDFFAGTDKKTFAFYLYENNPLIDIAKAIIG